VFEKLVYLVVKRCSSFLNILLKINYFCFRWQTSLFVFVCPWVW
jgi:hypothetical protein